MHSPHHRNDDVSDAGKEVRENADSVEELGLARPAQHDAARDYPSKASYTVKCGPGCVRTKGQWIRNVRSWAGSGRTAGSTVR